MKRKKEEKTKRKKETRYLTHALTGADVALVEGAPIHLETNRNTQKQMMKRTNKKEFLRPSRKTRRSARNVFQDGRVVRPTNGNARRPSYAMDAKETPCGWPIKVRVSRPSCKTRRFGSKRLTEWTRRPANQWERETAVLHDGHCLVS